MRRDSESQFKMNDIRQNLKCFLFIFIFCSFLIAILSIKLKKIENESKYVDNEYSPHENIKRKNFFEFYEEVKYLGQVKKFLNSLKFLNF